MSEIYRVYGVELSPFSVKVRSYLRYKQVPHEWVVRNVDTMADYQKYAKLPIIPLVVTPEKQGIQDSTPIMETIDERFPEPSTHPPDSTTGFLSLLLEEFGDEWGNKWMFHLRWAREEDQLSAGGRIAATMAPAGDESARLAIRTKVIERMLGRTFFVGSSAQTAPQIEDSFREAIEQLEAHLATRPYLFGGRPSFGDFGLWGQIYNAWTDPTGAAWIESTAPSVLDWIQRMLWPRVEGEFESWASLETTLAPFIERQVGALFLPWTVANAAAMAAGEEEFSVELDGRTFSQKPQKYHAKSLAVLREKYAAVTDRPSLDTVLEKLGCLAPLAG
ncbi:MAG: glutathione S-transferase family protein [Deltaproteobacteria bacterium]|jgi:glutathione S-transferase|nr:glutathione S-transferase family protein [Deltaproteobacteria bacterium]